MEGNVPSEGIYDKEYKAEEAQLVVKKEKKTNKLQLALVI